MPREIIHWDVLERTRAGLEANGQPELARVLTEHRPAAYLGAMAPDAPYYAYLGASEMRTMLAEIIHGRGGEDTYVFPRSLATAIESRESEMDAREGLAFLMGVLSHIITDVHFHPMIFYFTGDYYHADPEERRGARARHRLFEVYLDCWFAPQLRFWNSGSIHRTLQDLGPKGTKLFQLIGEACADVTDEEQVEALPFALAHGAVWQQNYRHMAICQSAFRSTFLGATVRALNLLSGGRLAQYDALFAFGRCRKHAELDGPLQYRNPVTGEERTATLEGLRDEAVASSLEVLSECGEVLARQSGGFLRHRRGASLNYGLPGVSVAQARHFSPAGFPLPGLRLRPKGANA